MAAFGQKWLYSGKIVVFVKKLFSGKSGCIRATMVVLGQSGCIRAKVVVFEQCGCIRAKVVVFG